MHQVVQVVQPEHPEVLVVAVPVEAAVYTMDVILEMVVLVEPVEPEVKQGPVELEELEDHLVILEAQETLERQVLKVLLERQETLERQVEIIGDKAMLVLLGHLDQPVL